MVLQLSWRIAGMALRMAAALDPITGMGWL
jgi:hypothetical protein